MSSRYPGPAIITELPGPRARDLLARDRASVSPSYPRAYPFVMDHGEGVWAWDVDGNRFLDLFAGIAVSTTGYRHPEVTAAITAQVERFLHVCGSDVYYEPMIELAEQLAAAAPGAESKRVFFTNSGTEATEGAIKLARHHTGRHAIIAFHGGFHGRSYGALSLTASASRYRRRFGPLLPGVYHAPFGAEGVAYIEEVLFKKLVHPDDVAAIVVEPIQGEGGYVFPPADFLVGLQALARRYGILLVADEVQSGMGRTGRLFAVEHWGVEPDVLLLAKGLASGLPLGAIIARASVMDWPAGTHGTTCGGNPVACAAALATLRLLHGGLMTQAAQVGETMRTALEGLAARRRLLRNPRGLGLMLAVDVVDEEGMPSGELRDALVQACFRAGLLVLGAGAASIRLTPALVLTPEEAVIGLGVLEHAVQMLER
jgi:4-aminobutyrate aminotransferase